MEMNFVNPSETREAFEHRFHLTTEMQRRSNLKIPNGLGAGLEKVRYLPNGRIDLLSIDEMARATTLATMAMKFSSIVQQGIGDDAMK